MAHRRRRIGVVNALVSDSKVNGLIVEESSELDKMFIKLGKIGGYSRFREKSDVWSYFGQLYYR